MFDIGISELGVIGVVALIVLGPEKLPRVARTVGNLMGRAQRYMAEVKSEVNRQIELEELRSVKSAVETSVRDIQDSVSKNLGDVRDEFDTAWKEATAGLPGMGSADAAKDASGEPLGPYLAEPGRAKRLKRSGGGSVPLWYRRHSRLRGHALSGAARMARYRVRTRA
jgi:sec-independent protein translocase protein TatB